MKISFYFAFTLLLLTLSTLLPVYADSFRIMDGAALQYEYARVGSTGGGQTGNLTFTIVSLNQTAVAFQINGTSRAEVDSYQIRYRDGLPVYADRLEALIYLPPECVAESLQGKLNWIASLQSTTLATVTNETGQTQSFIAPAGSFQTLNLTLSLVGWEYGTLTLLYSVDSGILVYEQWVPSPYGDIITQELTAVTYPFAVRLALPDFLVPTATLILPIGTAISEALGTLRRRGKRKQGAPAENGELQSIPRKTSLYVGLSGALLILASVSLPWSQLMGLQVYLPLSLPIFVAGSTLFSLPTTASVTATLLAHSAAIAAWVGVAVEVYARRKLATQLIATSSALLAFASAAILAQAGWSLFWGSLAAMTGGAIMLASVAVRRKKKTAGFA